MAEWLIGPFLAEAAGWAILGVVLVAGAGAALAWRLLR